MDQSRKDSILEATANIALGMVIAWSITFTANTYITTPSTAATASVFGCTVWSFIRQYYIRRYFNARSKNSSL